MKSSKLILGALTGVALGMIASTAVFASDHEEDRKGSEATEQSSSIEHKEKSDMDKGHETDEQGEAESEEHDHDSKDNDEKESEQRDSK
ncbi:MAG: hypothetical protein M1283_05190 [Gammaproteobacteria bacterium]|nr:hypothetical protein [Gammaproteobacteria bacterium]